MQNEILTVKDVAQEAGVDESTVRRWCISGKLQSSKLGARVWMVTRSALQEFLQSQGHQPS